MPTNKELEARLDAVAASHERLLAACRRLLAHVEVVAVAVRNRDAVPEADLAEAVTGLHDLQADLVEAEAPPRS